MTVVRRDAKGLFIRAGGYLARPGAVRGYDHAYRMDDGGLKEGEKVNAKHRPGTPIVTLILPAGLKLFWHTAPD